MTDQEIKKAFDTMKRGLAKEIGISSGYYCKAKQIENRTATLLVCNDIPYEDEIASAKAMDERVQSYDTWTDESKARHHSYALDAIARYQARLDKYGTKQGELIAVLHALQGSKSFQNFAAHFDHVSLTTEAKNGCHYIRFNY